jgi:hypothetical protein
LPAQANPNPNHTPPPGPRGRPPIDDLRALQIGPHAFLQRAAAQYGDVLRYPLGPHPHLVSHRTVSTHSQDNARNFSKDTFNTSCWAPSQPRTADQ